MDTNKVNVKSISWLGHDFTQANDWTCAHCSERYPEDGRPPQRCVAGLTQGLVIYGYCETGSPEDGNVFPFRSDDDARRHAEQSGLDESDLRFWVRAPTQPELDMIEFGARLAWGAAEV